MVNVLDIAEQLENSASNVHGPAYTAMMNARKLLICSRSMPVTRSLLECSEDVAASLQKLSGTVHSAASGAMLEARKALLDLVSQSEPAFA